MPTRSAALSAAGLLALGACASVPLPMPAPAQPRIAAESASSPRKADPRLHGPAVESDDGWSLVSELELTADTEASPLALAPQGPGPRFKPQPSLGSSRVLLGYQDLDEDYWQPSDGYAAVGMETSFERMGDWIGGEGGWLFSMQDERDTIGDEVIGVDRTQIEVYFGIHRTFLREGFVRPYVGAGGAFLLLEADQEIGPVGGVYASDEERELALGAYVHGGVSFQLADTWQIGLDYRLLASTPVDVLAGDEGDANYNLLSLFIGYGG